jgi:hypothetical protein
MLSVGDKCGEAITNQTSPNAPGKVKIRSEDEKAKGLRTHSNGLEVNVSSGHLKRAVRPVRIIQAIRWKAHLKRCPEDG